ncbi:MAG TPA: RDD family protein [Vicinamibacterales bacterium]|jgi:uncharacterized RDD family membrane protein YckC
MRCPKCHYISFGSVTRCRNCGYEFSLAPENTPLDLPIQDADPPLGPMSDLRLSDRSAMQPAPDDNAARRAAAAPRLDLPLFSDRSRVDDAPLVSAPAVPRPPLSVRRAPPPIVKPKIEKSAPESDSLLAPDDDSDDGIDTGGEEEDRKREQEFRRLSQSLRAAKQAAARAPVELVVASAGARLLGGLVDVLLLASIDAAVLYFTLRVLGLTFADIRVLPPIPIAIFLLLLNGGYLATFTAAGGQTIGKMLTGIRVVAARPEDDEGFEAFNLRVSLGAAVVRAAAYLVSLLPAGLGFAAILFDAEGRALHDRLSNTRVVRA